MSSKGTLFLTDDNEHVYNETNDFSVVFEIKKDSMEKVMIETYEEINNTVVHSVKNIIDEIDEYIVIQTRDHYHFLECYKSLLRPIGTFDNFETVGHNCLTFRMHELQSIEDCINDIKIPYQIRVYVKKDSNWYKDYIKHLERCIKSDIKTLQNKLQEVKHEHI